MKIYMMYLQYIYIYTIHIYIYCKYKHVYIFTRNPWVFFWGEKRGFKISYMHYVCVYIRKYTHIYIYIYRPRTQMTHTLEDLTDKMVPVKPPQKRGQLLLGSR